MNYSAQHCSSSGQTTSPAFLAGSSLLGGLITGFWQDLFCPMLPDSWLRHRPQLNTYMELLFGNNQFPPPCSHTTKRRRKIRYKSPEGRVFHSRGPLIRFISFTFKTLSMSLFWQISLWEQPQEKTAAENIEKTAENQPGSPVWRVAQKWQVNIFPMHVYTWSGVNRFIKHLDVDWNFLLFLRQRYDNHVDLPEVWLMIVF